MGKPTENWFEKGLVRVAELSVRRMVVGFVIHTAYFYCSSLFCLDVC